MFLYKGQVYYSRFSTGDILSRMTADVDQISGLASWCMASLSFSLASICIYFFLMVRSGGWFLSLVTISPFFLLLVFSRLRERETENRYQAQQKIYAEMNDRVLEGIEGVRHIRVYRREEAFAGRFQKSPGPIERFQINFAN